MNVAFETWIPVISLDGKPQRISLLDVFIEGEAYSDLAVRPHERVSLMRLFLCVAHAALNGPEDYDVWKKVPNVLPNAATAYLEKWKDSFELFHPTKPWLQVAELMPLGANSKKDQEEWKPLGRLSYLLASGNNTTLFDHSAMNKELPIYNDADIALNLISFQNFFVAGGQASGRHWGDIKMSNPPNPTGGPCSGKSILFTFLRGKTLSESVHLNLNSFENLEFLYQKQDDFIGKPIWEKPILNPSDSEAINNATKTYLGRLVPQTRILKLHEDRKRVLLGAGFYFPKFQDKNSFPPDPFATVYVQNNEHKLLSASPTRAIWRQLHAIGIHQINNNPQARGPLCLMNIPNENEPLDIVVCAMLTNPKQSAEVVYLLDSSFHLPSQFSSPDKLTTYEEGVKTAENIGSKLTRAIEVYRQSIDEDWKNKRKKDKNAFIKLTLGGSNYYWTTVEKQLHLLWAVVEALGTDRMVPHKELWRNTCFKTACNAYKIVCGINTPCQQKAFAKGWAVLVHKKSEANDPREEVADSE